LQVPVVDHTLSELFEKLNVVHPFDAALPTHGAKDFGSARHGRVDHRVIVRVS
jgi:hypothetical protein